MLLLQRYKIIFLLEYCFYIFATYLNNSVMPKKPYKIKDDAPMSNNWNPNVPFCGTQEEWWDHFHRIEEGHFMSLEDANKEFEAWKKEYLASRLK
jgi:hypothetical protein